MKIEESLQEKVVFDSNLEQWVIKANEMADRVTSGGECSILRRSPSRHCRNIEKWAHRTNLEQRQTYWNNYLDWSLSYTCWSPRSKLPDWSWLEDWLYTVEMDLTLPLPKSVSWWGWWDKLPLTSVYAHVCVSILYGCVYIVWPFTQCSLGNGITWHQGKENKHTAYTGDSNWGDLQ